MPLLTCVPLWANTLLLKKTTLDQGWQGEGSPSAVTGRSNGACQRQHEPRCSHIELFGQLPVYCAPLLASRTRLVRFSVEMYGAWRSGSAWTERVPRRDTKDKRGRSASICVLIGVRGVEGGTPIRLDWMWPPWDPVLKRGPTARVAINA